MRLVLALLREPQTGQERRRRYEEDIGLHETFLEAVPTTLVLTVIWVTSFSK